MKARHLLLAGALGLASIASTAGAQEEYGTYYRSDAPEVVIVRRPHYGPRYSWNGAPIENVTLQRAVRIDDLDLTSDWGVQRLRDRISIQARLLCQELDRLYPASLDETHGGWPLDSNCYDRAVDDAMYQAGPAIRAARGYKD